MCLCHPNLKPPLSIAVTPDTSPFSGSPPATKRWSPMVAQRMMAAGGGYQAFVDHPLMLLALAGQPYDLGSSETDATHWLIVDRKTRTTALAPRPQAEAFLTQQHPALPIVHLTREEWLAAIQAASAQLQAHLAQTTVLDIRERLDAQNQIIREMTAWLNARLPADWQARVIHRLETVV